MIELPVCRWRKAEISPGRYGCCSPKLIVGPAGVPAELCRKCYACDHEPTKPTTRPPAEPRPTPRPVAPVRPPCVRLGIVVEPCYSCKGGLRDVRECEHFSDLTGELVICTRVRVNPFVRACSECEAYPVLNPGAVDSAGAGG